MFSRKEGLTVENGISIYPGLDNALQENLDLIKKAHTHGLTRVFTSLHIPETDADKFKKEITETFHAAHDCGMEIIADVSPETREFLGLKEFRSSALKMLGIATLRLDYGFGLESIAHLSRHSHGLNLQLNASTMTGKILTSLIEMKTNFRQIDALHNFYPRVGTGLSEETLVRKNVMLHKMGIRVGAFVPTALGRRRSPLQDGLPTLEDHRTEQVELAARHLVALGIDSVILSDSLPTDEEIAALGALRGGQVTISAKLLTKDRLCKKLLEGTFTARIDEARDAVRAQEGRPHLQALNKAIKADGKAAPRPQGTVTLDNENYGRYMGELQIIKNDLPGDPRINVVAQIDEEELGMLQYITPGRKFSFRLHR